MKRFHVHVSVDDLPRNVRFYSALFGTAPTVEKTDYAKWMLDEPRINFAISQRGAAAGVNHLGIQVDSEGELKSLRTQVAMTDIAARDELAANCCYVKSDKYWVEDPQGIPWETFYTLNDIPVFGGHETATATTPEACCVPTPRVETRNCC